MLGKDRNTSVTGSSPPCLTLFRSLEVNLTEVPLLRGRDEDVAKGPEILPGFTKPVCGVRIEGAREFAAELISVTSESPLNASGSNYDEERK